MSALDDAQRRAASAYNAAADFYDHPANSFREQFGRRTVTRLALASGARVLDVCCGSGASALPAAEAVGSRGYVLGVDLADSLLDLARHKAAARGLRNLEFRHGDLLALGLPEESFDAVICVFGIFLVPDMQQAVRALWRVVRPGGRLAVTTWGPRFFEPANGAFWEAVRAERPDLHKGFNPWDCISAPDALRDMLAAAGASAPEVVAEAKSQALRSPDDWWPMMLGSGRRGTIEQLDEGARERVRVACRRFIEAHAVGAVEANVMYAVAAKPPP